jgi:hypothetical protein
MADLDAGGSGNPAPDNGDALYLEALEYQRKQLSMVQWLRADYVKRLNQLTDEQWPGNVGMDEKKRLAEIEDIRQRLGNMESWDATYLKNIAEIERLYKQTRDLRTIKEGAGKAQARIRSKREQKAFASLISRCFNPYCEWERNHVSDLLTLVLWPERSSWFFRLCNRVHALLHHH